MLALKHALVKTEVDRECTSQISIRQSKADQQIPKVVISLHLYKLDRLHHNSLSLQDSVIIKEVHNTT